MTSSAAALVEDLESEMTSSTDLLRYAGGRLDVRVTSQGWTVRDTIVHLIETDQLAARAINAEPGQGGAVDPPPRPDGLRTAMMLGAVDLSVLELTSLRQIACQRLLAATVGRSLDHRVPWGATPMRASSLVQARIMEHWAHGVDIAVALDRPVEISSRIRHVIDLAYRGRHIAFGRFEQSVPKGDLAVRVRAPDGTLWSWGTDSTDHVVSGPARELALVAVRRLSPRCSGLTASTEAAARYLDQTQAFGGPLSQLPVCDERCRCAPTTPRNA